MSSTSSLPVIEEASTYNEFFSNGLQDLLQLKMQFYSAAEYFEMSFIKDDKKEILVNTLKDYAYKALASTIGHMGSLAYRVNGLLDEKVDEVSDTRLQVSNIEQRFQTCQAHIDKEGISQQSLQIPNIKHNKRYTLPVGRSLNGCGQGAFKNEDFVHKEDEWHVVRTAIFSTIKEKPPISSIKTFASSPTSLCRNFIFAEKTSAAQNRSSRLILPSSLSRRSISFSIFNQKEKDHSSLRKSASMRVVGEMHVRKEDEQISSRSKRFLKILTSRSKPRNDPVVHNYLKHV